MFSRDEYKQFLLQEKLSSHPKKKSIRFLIGDIRDSDRLDMAFRGVDYVVHAAAMKQIPTTEKEPLECIKTNIYGATNVIRSALKNKVKKKQKFEKKFLKNKSLNTFHHYYTLPNF